MFLLAASLFTATALPANAGPEEVRITIKGKVLDLYSRQPLTGAGIFATGYAQGAASDINGEFSLKLDATLPLTIEVSYIGYKSKTVTIETADAGTIFLEEDEQILDEVLVVGYAQLTKNAMTSAVATVQGDALENIQSADINDKIQGAVPGLLISSNAGVPGGSSFIRLRGATSISAANTPIYIVDGVFVNTDNMQRTDLGGMGVDPIADINPDDILSVTVLKDASATAAYGARAANGVIIINTKRGGQGQKTVVNFKAQVGLQKASNLWSLVTGPEHAELVNAAWINDGKDPSLVPFRSSSLAVTGYPAYGTPEEQITVDRLSDIFRTAVQQTYNLSVSGGSENTNFYVGGEYTHQDATLKLIDFERTSVRFNLDHNVRSNVKLMTSNSVVFTRRNQMRIGDGPAGFFQAALHTPTFYPVYKEDGSYNKPVSFDNHMAILDNWNGGSSSFRTTNSVSLKWDILPSLSLKVSLNNDRTTYQERFYYNTNLIYGQPDGTGVEGTTVNNIFSTEEVLNYFNNSLGRLSLSAFLGTSYQLNKSDWNYMRGEGFASDQLTRIVSSAKQTATSSGTSSALLSFFGGANMMYDSRYSLDFTMRVDGSSRVGKNNRFGVFPAVGVSWNIMNEDFFPQIDQVNSLRLKASLGLGGNENIGDFSYMSLWNGGANYNGNAGLSPQQLENPDLKWETTRQWNVGVTASLFRKRIDVELNYYDKYTYDLLLAQSVPWKTGFTSIMDNAGEMSNRGMEFSLSSLNISRGNFSWNTQFTLAHNSNRIEKLPTDISGGYTPFKLFEGYPLYSMWVYNYEGVNPATGDAIYTDKNTDGKITVDDKMVVGNAWPVIEGMLRNTFTYKSLSLDVNFYYKYGNKVFNYTRMFLESGGTRGITRSMQSSSTNYWKQPGDTDVLPRPKSTANADGSFNYEGQSSRVVEDGSFIRLKNVTLSWSLPSAWLVRTGISRASITLTGSNLLLLTRYSGPDPEVNVNGDEVNGLVQGMDFGMPPQPRGFSAGINLSF